MLECSEILARHSDYIDGALTPGEAEIVESHLARCSSCARYDHVLRQGVRLLAARPQLEPPPEFLQNLQYRIAAEEDRLMLRPISFNAGATATILTVLALAAWLPGLWLSRSDSPTTDAPPTMAVSDLRASEIAWHGGNAVDDSITDHKYSPLVLDPPTTPPGYSTVLFTTLQAR